MLRDSALKLVTDIDDMGRGTGKLILAALMTETMTRDDMVHNPETYLFELCRYYDLLNDPLRLEKIFSTNPNFVEK